jgi:spermidine synthase
MKIVKKSIKQILEFVFLRLASASRAVAGLAHFGLYVVQWGMKPTPNWFDHNIDVYWKLWKKSDSSWLERGVLNSLCLAGGNALELTCGDGFYTSRFYAAKLNSMVACDRDPKAIESARKYSRASNVSYVVADILTEIPSGKFHNVVWDFGFPWCNHFSSPQVDAIVAQCKDRLTESGIFSGYLALLSQNGMYAQNEHATEIDFKDISALKTYLLRYFSHVSVIETSSPGRHNAYFFASNHAVPFADGWPHKV